MAQTTVAGGDWLSLFADNFSQMPFDNYLSFRTLSSETWSSQTYDPDASKRSLNFTSGSGSTIKFSETSLGTESTSGSNKGTLAVIGKLDGINFSSTWSDSWSGMSSSTSDNVSMTYTGGTVTKDDDFTYKYTSSPQSKWKDTTSGQSGTYLDKASLQFTNSHYIYNFSWSGSGSYIWNSSSQSTTSVLYSGSGAYSFTDKVNNISLSMSFKQTQDKSIDQDTWNLTNIKYVTSDLSITTQKFTTIVAFEGFNELGKIAHFQNDLETISNNIQSFSELFIVSDSTINIKSTTGSSIDAGSGNDTVTGGNGDDSIIGGSGNDKLTGSAGADIIHGDVAHSYDTYENVKGKDTLIGGDGNDQLDGGYGDGSLTGGNGNDLLYGAGGTDIMSGDAGDDILVAYQTKDQMTGGAGSDTFVFYDWDNTAMNATVKDFKSGTDFLDVECWSDSLNDVVVMDSTNFSSGKGLKSSASDSLFVYDTSTGNLYFDSDASGSGKGVLIVTLTGKPTLLTSDFKVADLSGFDLFA